MDDDRCRARQIVLDVLEEGKYMLRGRYDAAREDKSREGTRFGGEGKRWRTVRETSGVAKRVAKV
jgi:hypothetical protein